MGTTGDWKPSTPLAQAVYDAGFQYDPKQDIIVSRMWAWQRAVGFTWAYDVASPKVLMCIDCETFYFRYGGKIWLIELWKGQYGCETGAEIGVYCVDDMTALFRHKNAASPENPVPGFNAAREMVDQSRFYPSAKPSEMLRMSFQLYRDGVPFLHRGPEPHWWLTGFKWGEFTASSLQLTMEGVIEFKSADMCERFKEAMRNKGYTPRESGLVVGFTFGRPFTKQPLTRAIFERESQETNKEIVQRYRELKNELKITGNDPNSFTMAALGQAGLTRARDFAAEILAVNKRVKDAELAMIGAVLAASKKQKEAELKAALAAKEAILNAAAKAKQNIKDHQAQQGAGIFAFFENKTWRGVRAPSA